MSKKKKVEIALMDLDAPLPLTELDSMIPVAREILQKRAISAAEVREALLYITEHWRDEKYKGNLDYKKYLRILAILWKKVSLFEELGISSEQADKKLSEKTDTNENKSSQDAALDAFEEIMRHMFPGAFTKIPRELTPEMLRILEEMEDDNGK